MKKKVKNILCWLSIVLIIQAGCAGVTQKPQEKKYGAGFNLFSEKAELALGKNFSQEVEKELPILQQPTVNSYVDGLGQKLAACCKRPDIPYHFKVVDVKEVNAFALPGGYIYVNRGMIEAVDDESQLAAVIGHEIGHVVGRHGTKQLSKRLLLTGIVLGASAVISRKNEKWGKIVQIAGSMGMLMGMMKYSRNDEREADYLGIHNIYDSGYNPRGMLGLFQKFQQIRKQEPNKLELLFATHPPPSERIERVSAELQNMGLEEGVYGDSLEFTQVKQIIVKLPPPPKGEKREIEIPASEPWLDTNINLSKGQKVEIVSRGEICLQDKPGYCCGPDGLSGKKSFWSPMEGENLGALIAKIGSEGEPFIIGSRQSGTVQGGGRLYLGINDSAHNDNSGSFLVTITIIRK